MRTSMSEGTKEQQIVAIRFQPVGKLYYFDASGIEDVNPGDYVIVSTSRGRELAQVAQYVADPGRPASGQFKAVERKATPRELVLNRIWKGRELEAMLKCREKAAELGLKAIRIAEAQFSFDGSRLTFMYTTEGDEKVNLNNLQRAMKRSYRKAWVEMRQVGPRDAAKVVGGMGACGLTERCCSRFLTEFSPISIRMAKAQGISLNPQEITGMCGRLRCCLLYEYKLYTEARKELPKRKKRVVTPLGEGRVVDVLALKQSVIVRLEGGKRAEFHKDEIQPYDELKALEEKANQPCAKHGNGESDSGEGKDS